MADKRQIDGAPGRRAGMPLARAQRLVEHTNEARGGMSKAIVGLGIVSVGTLIGVGLMEGERSGANAAVGDAAIASAPQPAAPGTPPVEQEAIATLPAAPEADPLPMSAPDPAPSSQSEGTVVASLEEPAVAAIEPSGPYCIQVIETQLLDLRASAANDAAWDAKQDDVAQLVQSALDCREAGLEITGSLELIDTPVADLKVTWDRDAWSLALVMIDSAEPTDPTPSESDSGRSIEFVVR